MRVDLGKLRQASPKEMATRFALGAAVSVSAGLIAKSTGARLGGVFLAFPAILPASLTFVQKKEGSRTADRDALGAILGGLGLVAFATVGESMFGRHVAPLVLLSALAAWLATSLVLYAGLVLLGPERCHRKPDRRPVSSPDAAHPPVPARAAGPAGPRHL